MSAMETFCKFNDSLSETERKLLKDLIQSRSEELLSARSEDARVRLTTAYIEEAKECLVSQRRRD